MGLVIMFDMLNLLISERYGDLKILNFKELILYAFYWVIIVCISANFLKTRFSVTNNIASGRTVISKMSLLI
jgi:hypothetical protein